MRSERTERLRSLCELFGLGIKEACAIVGISRATPAARVKNHLSAHWLDVLHAHELDALEAVLATRVKQAVALALALKGGVDERT